MEDALREFDLVAERYINTVLILVLMEDALRVLEDVEYHNITEPS